MLADYARMDIEPAILDADVGDVNWGFKESIGSHLLLIE